MYSSVILARSVLQPPYCLILEHFCHPPHTWCWVTLGLLQLHGLACEQPEAARGPHRAEGVQEHVVPTEQRVCKAACAACAVRRSSLPHGGQALAHHMATQHSVDG